MQRFGTRSFIPFTSLLCLTAAVAGCSSNSVTPSPNAATGGSGSTTPGGSGASTSTGATGSTTGGAPVMVPTGMAPASNCSGLTVPETFIATCSGCHTPSGNANSNFPDLYKFKGTLDEFKTHVRNGGKIMAAYPASIIGDADLETVYKYFTTTGDRNMAVAPSLGGVMPLFNPADAVNPPVVTVRPDGVIVTRGAGRVRGRHEKEGTFASFEPHYFERKSPHF